MTKRYFYIVLFLFVFILTTGCTSADHPASSPTPTDSVPTAETPSPAASPSSDPLQPPDPLYQAVLKLTTEEKVGQLLVVGITGTSPARDALWAIQEARVGGIVLFGRNVADASQLLELTNGLKELNRAAGNTPLFLCVDQEGGAVSRMPPGLTALPTPYDYISAGKDAAQWGQVLAAECAAFGFNTDFAPVLDVWSNPGNTVIGKRSFSSQPQSAADAATQTVSSMLEERIIPVGKHFPGHGDTETDSHVGLPVVDKSLEELWDMELLPFRQSIDNGLPAVMAAHILMKQLDPENPASLSPAVVDGLLREELGFDGVVFTDDLTMGAITNTYGVGEAAVRAIEAGCDMALVCHGWDEAQEVYAALLEAVYSGRISPSRLDDSVRRILALKDQYAVSDEAQEMPDLESLNALIGEALNSSSFS